MPNALRCLLYVHNMYLPRRLNLISNFLSLGVYLQKEKKNVLWLLNKKRKKVDLNV